MTNTTGAAELPEALTARIIEALYENGDPVSVDAAEEMKRLHAQVEALSAAQAGVPAGYVLVPLEPTPAMKAEGRKAVQASEGSSSAGVAVCAYEAMLSAALQPSPSPAPAEGNWIAAGDVKRLVRELDVALNGKEGAAQQASLCDVVSQVVHEATKLWRPLIPAPAQPVQDLQAVNDAVTIDLLNERVAYLEAQLAKATAPAQPGQEGERDTERTAFKAAHQHLELDEMPDAWGRPMFKHSHVEASWFGWIARAARAAPQPATADAVDAVDADCWRRVVERIDDQSIDLAAMVRTLVAARATHQGDQT